MEPKGEIFQERDNAKREHTLAAWPAAHDAQRHPPPVLRHAPGVVARARGQRPRVRGRLRCARLHQLRLALSCCATPAHALLSNRYKLYDHLLTHDTIDEGVVLTSGRIGALPPLQEKGTCSCDVCQCVNGTGKVHARSPRRVTMICVQEQSTVEAGCRKLLSHGCLCHCLTVPWYPAALLLSRQVVTKNRIGAPDRASPGALLSLSTSAVTAATSCATRSADGNTTACARLSKSCARLSEKRRLKSP